MGDVVSLVEKAQEHFDEEESARMAEKMLKAEFDFEDFLSQMKQMKKLGFMGSIAKMLPGMGNVQVGDKEEAALGRHEAIIHSMTKQEHAGYHGSLAGPAGKESQMGRAFKLGMLIC